jgi:hypothetical protein
VHHKDFFSSLVKVHIQQAILNIRTLLALLALLALLDLLALLGLR